jgi:periplasmic protein CpxP/Spy
MSDTSLEPTGSNEKPRALPPRRRLLRRSLLGLGVVAGLGVGGYALAMGGGFPGGFHGPWDPAKRLEHMQAFSKRVLDGIGASTDQENKIHDIIANAFTAVNKDRKPPEEIRKRMTELMKSPTVDRAAIESLRAEMVAKFDAHSKVIANAIADAGNQLSAEQRSQLADRLTAMMDQRRGFGGWHKPWGERPWGPGRSGEDGPEGGPHPDGPPGGRPGAN